MKFIIYFLIERRFWLITIRTNKDVPRGGKQSPNWTRKTVKAQKEKISIRWISCEFKVRVGMLQEKAFRNRHSLQMTSMPRFKRPIRVVATVRLLRRAQQSAGQNGKKNT